MRVTVTRQGRLTEGRPSGEETLDLAEGARTQDLLAACGLDSRTCIVVLNGVAVPRGTRLSDGDRARLFPAQAGG